MANLHDYIEESGCHVSYEIEVECSICKGTHVVKVSKNGIYHFACDGEAFYGRLDLTTFETSDVVH